MKEMTKGRSTESRAGIRWAGLFLLFAAISLGGVLFWGVASGVLDDVSHWIYRVQGDLHRRMTEAVSLVNRTPSPQAWMTLLGLSLFYGIFHAAGPGHGKAVLSTYLLSQRQGTGGWRKALGLSFAAAIVQGMVAIAIVLVLVNVLGWLTREALGSVIRVEQLSFLLVALLGAWLCLRAIRDFIRLQRSASEQPAGHQHAHEQHTHEHHDHAHEHHAHPHQAHQYHDHVCCGGHHHLSPADLADSGQKSTVWLTVLAIGARPCSGAVLLMGVTTLLGQPLMGIAAVMVMALGTALTVSALGLLSVLARGWAERRLASHRHWSVGWIMPLVALTGGVVICVLGVSLLLHAEQGAGSLPLLVAPRGGGGLTGG
ncbi:nickel/cobalt transporter [Halomonas binhaiensis]|uniref:Nickel/cobalt efflux system n=1 Tax=Halomonas binhaiensis TaxID=2562282 RepID=A0A5C1N9M0_9GAMM|nr:nickel/cobalt transporter [Halomonas binhaiensis]QEM80392.1 nickel/cobalt transporter [Halomonas binhaiensis]